MPDWLIAAMADGPDRIFMTLAVRLAAGLVFGWAVAIAYRITQGRRDDYRASFAVTLVMLTVTLALITQVIGDNQALAFSLVGSLAVVRFRTVVNDTRDTAFVILAVGIGMAAGSGMFLAALIGVPAVGLIATLLPGPGRAGAAGGRAGEAAAGRHTLVVRVDPGLEPEAALAPVFEPHLRVWRCDGVESAKQGAALDLSYVVRLRDDTAALALVRALKAVAGVLDVELRRR